MFLVIRFTDPQYWLKYFPPLTQEDLKALGVRVSVCYMHILLYTVCIKEVAVLFRVHTVPTV